MRVGVLDILKGIAIIMIVNVHLISGPCFSIGGTFHVVAFFFASGIIHGIKEKWNYVPFKTFLRQKVSRLIYPYLTLSVCYILFHILLNIIRGDIVFNDVIKDSLIKTATFKGIGTLWFLPVLFGGEVLFFVTKKFNVQDWISILAGVVAILLSSILDTYGICGSQWYGDNSTYGIWVNNPLTLILSSIIAFWFLTIGFICSKTIPIVFWTQEKSNKTMVLVIIVCLASLAVDYLCLDFYSGDLHKLIIGNPIIYIICSLSGILFVSSLSVIIEHYTRYISSFLEYCGKNSLIIMTTHSEYYINSIAYVSLTFVFSVFNGSVSNKLLSGLSLLLILLIEMGVCYIVNYTFLRHLYTLPVKQNNRCK